jgi:hypothetical protein
MLRVYEVAPGWDKYYLESLWRAKSLVGRIDRILQDIDLARQKFVDHIVGAKVCAAVARKSAIAQVIKQFDNGEGLLTASSRP